jgi:hypothetical protein
MPQANADGLRIICHDGIEVKKKSTAISPHSCHIVISETGIAWTTPLFYLSFFGILNTGEG